MTIRKKAVATPAEQDSFMIAREKAELQQVREQLLQRYGKALRHDFTEKELIDLLTKQNLTAGIAETKFLALARELRSVDAFDIDR